MALNLQPTIKHRGALIDFLTDYTTSTPTHQPTTQSISPSILSPRNSQVLITHPRNKSIRPQNPSKLNLEEDLNNRVVIQEWEIQIQSIHSLRSPTTYSRLASKPLPPSYFQARFLHHSCRVCLFSVLTFVRSCRFFPPPNST